MLICRRRPERGRYSWRWPRLAAAGGLSPGFVALAQHCVRGGRRRTEQNGRVPLPKLRSDRKRGQAG